jgi:cell wall-associated NlpC family hydrolase
MHHQLTDDFEAIRSRWRRPWVLAVAAGACAVLVGLSLLASGGAEAAPKPTAAQMAERVQQLRDKAEQSTERYNGLREQLRSLGVRLAAARARVAAQEKRVTGARAALGEVLAEAYKQGDLSGLALFLGDDPDAALERSGVVATLGERRSAALQQLSDEQGRLSAAADDLTTQQKRIADAGADLQKLRTTIGQQLQAARKELAQLQASERATVERLLNRGDTNITCSQAGVEFSGRAGTVLRYACAQLGDPYVWAADGPSSFDCSGLTMQAWQAAGVSLPHNADAQSHYGTRVRPNDETLQPGDLVFFHSPITHVGIYIGRGLMLHAPHTGTVVKIARVPWPSAVAAARY